jgi:hypothetical protein
MELGDKEYASVVFARVRRLLIREELLENLGERLVRRVWKAQGRKELKEVVVGQQEGRRRANMREFTKSLS